MSDRIQGLIDAGRLSRETAPDDEIAGLWANAVQAYTDARFPHLSTNGRLVRAYDGGRIAATRWCARETSVSAPPTITR